MFLNILFLQVERKILTAAQKRWLLLIADKNYLEKRNGS